MINVIQSAEAEPRRGYHAPIITEYGDVREIIKANTSGPHDDNSDGSGTMGGDGLRSV